MSPSVLIAESDELARTKGAEVLKALGFKTQLAASGPQALAVLEAHPVDVVLADTALAGVGGLELARIVKQKYPGTDIVLMADATVRAPALDKFTVTSPNRSTPASSGLCSNAWWNGRSLPTRTACSAHSSRRSAGWGA